MTSPDEGLKRLDELLDYMGFGDNVEAMLTDVCYDLDAWLIDGRREPAWDRHPDATRYFRAWRQAGR